MTDSDAKEICWFDELFHGGILLPEQKDRKNRAVTLLITGPPGTGKSTLALELCVRLASRREENQLKGCTLYVASEAYPPLMINNAKSFGWLKQAKKQVEAASGKLRRETDEDVRRRLFTIWPWQNPAPISVCTLEDCGKNSIGQFYHALRGVLGLEKNYSQGDLPYSSQEASHQNFDIVVIDSLNSVQTDRGKEFHKFYKDFLEGGPRLIVFVLDSSPTLPVAEPWEFAADIVLRLDKQDNNGYMIRTLEIVKARYQAHVARPSGG